MIADGNAAPARWLLLGQHLRAEISEGGSGAVIKQTDPDYAKHGSNKGDFH